MNNKYNFINFNNPAIAETRIYKKFFGVTEGSFSYDDGYYQVKIEINIHSNYKILLSIPDCGGHVSHPKSVKQYEWIKNILAEIGESNEIYIGCWDVKKVKNLNILNEIFLNEDVKLESIYFDFPVSQIWNFIHNINISKYNLHYIKLYSQDNKDEIIVEINNKIFKMILDEYNSLKNAELSNNDSITRLIKILQQNTIKYNMINASVNYHENKIKRWNLLK